MNIKNLIHRILNRCINVSPANKQICDMQYSIDYLTLEVSRLRSLVRYLSADVINDLPIIPK